MTETAETSAAETKPEVKAATPTEGGEEGAAATNDGGDATVAAANKEEQTNGGSTPDKGEDKEEKEPPKEMRAIVLTGFGGYKGVKIQKKPEPTPQEGEVLIRVRAW